MYCPVTSVRPRDSGIDTEPERDKRVAVLTEKLLRAAPTEIEYHLRMAFIAAQYDACTRQQAITMEAALAIIGDAS
jgi:hypothetical protein